MVSSTGKSDRIQGRPPELEHIVWLAEQSSDAIVITDANGVIEYVNPSFETLTGYSRRDAVGRTPAIVKSGYHDEAFYRVLWETLRAGKEYREVLVNRRKSGEAYNEEKAIRPFADATGRITHFISTGRDVTDRVRTMEKLAYAATHDALTELPNRSLYFDRLAQALRHAARRNASFTVGVADIDRFKTVNDSLGHVAGDCLLKAVAQHLVSCLRETDTVARLGGDEFGLILLDAGDPASAVHTLAKLVHAFVAPLQIEGQPFQATISIGACLYPAHAREALELLERADQAMYQAKRTGGNAYRLYGVPATG